MPRGMSERRRGTSLATQVTVAGVGFGLLVAVVFGLLVHAVREQRDATRRTTAAADFVATGNRLERLVIDSETAMRGFVISGDPRFLSPLEGAKTQIPEDFARLRVLAAGTWRRRARLSALQAAVDAYLRDWIDRVVAVARTDRPRARRLVSGGGGKRRVDAIRGPVRRAARRPPAGRRRPGRPRGDRARTATVLGVAGVVGSILVFAVFATYVVRAILAPVRRTARPAGADRARATSPRAWRGPTTRRRSSARWCAASTPWPTRSRTATTSSRRGARGSSARTASSRPSAASSSPSSASSRTRSAASRRRRPSARRWRRRRASRPLADLILARVADAVGADVGAIFARDARRDDALAPAVTRGLRREDLPERLEPGVGFAGRAAAELRTVTATSPRAEHAGADAYGLPVTVRHELHVPLVQSGQVFGVLSLARLAGDPCRRPSRSSRRTWPTRPPPRWPRRSRCARAARGWA